MWSRRSVPERERKKRKMKLVPEAQALVPILPGPSKPRLMVTETLDYSIRSLDKKQLMKLHRVFARAEGIPDMVMGKDHPLLRTLRDGGHQSRVPS